MIFNILFLVPYCPCQFIFSKVIYFDPVVYSKEHIFANVLYFAYKLPGNSFVNQYFIKFRIKCYSEVLIAFYNPAFYIFCLDL